MVAGVIVNSPKRSLILSRTSLILLFFSLPKLINGNCRFLLGIGEEQLTDIFDYNVVSMGNFGK